MIENISKIFVCIFLAAELEVLRDRFEALSKNNRLYNTATISERAFNVSGESTSDTERMLA